MAVVNENESPTGCCTKSRSTPSLRLGADSVERASVKGGRPPPCKVAGNTCVTLRDADPLHEVATSRPGILRDAVPNMAVVGAGHEGLIAGLPARRVARRSQ